MDRIVSYQNGNYTVYIDTTNLTVDEEVLIIKKILEGDK